MMLLDTQAFLWFVNGDSKHRDPFDRLIICQALAEDMTLVTSDDVIRKYHVRSRWE